MKRRSLLVAATPIVTLSGCIEQFQDFASNSTDSTDSEQTDSREPNVAVDVTLAEQFACELWSPDRCHLEPGRRTFETEDGREVESVGMIPYPDPPETFNRSTVGDYVKEFEAAYQRDDFICDPYKSRVIHFGYGGRISHFDWYDDIFIVRIDGQFSDSYLHRDGSETIGHWPTAAVYAVDETAALRRNANTMETSEAETPDPLDLGIIVDCFAE